MEDWVKIFKALSDKTRLRIMYLLIQARIELCVCEVMDSLEESQYNISRHLKELKATGLVRERKEGKWVFYSLQEKIKPSYTLILKVISEMPKGEFSSDIKRMRARLSLRRNGKCVVGMGGRR